MKLLSKRCIFYPLINPMLLSMPPPPWSEQFLISFICWPIFSSLGGEVHKWCDFKGILNHHKYAFPSKSRRNVLKRKIRNWTGFCPQALLVCPDSGSQDTQFLGLDSWLKSEQSELVITRPNILCFCFVIENWELVCLVLITWSAHSMWSTLSNHFVGSKHHARW